MEQKTKDNLNIKKAKQVLDEDHYNLEKIKERILEYLAVNKLRRKIKGPILCFVGPPSRKDFSGKIRRPCLGEKLLSEYHWAEFVMRRNSWSSANLCRCFAGSCHSGN